MARKSDPIKRVELKDGRARYRFVIDVGRKPDGKRDQKTYTYDTLKEARAERARIIADRAKGTFVRPDKKTVAELIDDWLAGKRNLGVGTRRTYADSLKHARGHIGHLEAQKVTKADIDSMVTRLLASGRRVGNVRSTKLAPRTVNVMLTLLAAVFESAVAQGFLGRNVVKLAERPKQTTTEMQTWTADSAASFLQAVSGERLYAAWQFSLYGLRRGEVLGLRWSDVDLVAKTITVQWSRTSVAGEIVEKEPKTERGRRTLPLDDDLVDALTKLQLAQREEREAAGEAYAKPCRLADPVSGEVCAGDHVVVDELGRPYRPEWYGDRFEALAKRAGLPVIRLHDTRHTCGTLMHLRGVPTAVISAWLGHASAAFTMRTYVHSQDDALTGAGETLRNALKGSPAAPKSAV
ncbi:site-specific integrase [Micromonospora sp. NPDC005367]|uniref:tyrosine-type recombinase/integrase n=1 Tax=Micromonospora sp. NPDC005367 TaxID=3155590 RepID=UPI0033BD8B8C